MLITRCVICILCCGLIALHMGVVSGQNYPNKPVRLIVTGGAGGGNDIVARPLAQWLTGSLGQTAIVDNREGNVVPVELVAKAPPDGYTVLITSNVFWILPFLYKTPYDPVKDLEPITWITNSPQILAVLSSTPVKSVKELIAWAKATPQDLNYGSGPIGSASHLAGELFKSTAGIKMVVIPYKGGAPAMNALLGGEVQMILPTAGVVAPHIKSGRVRALAVTSAKPSALFPDLPTVAATLPGFEVGTMVVAFAPAKTPAAIINRLHQEMVQGLNKQEIKEAYYNMGLETVGSSPVQLAAAERAEMARMGKVIKDAGIKLPE